jgi:peptidoglycan/LPS O-acetylase OafA/YrhL
MIATVTWLRAGACLFIFMSHFLNVGWLGSVGIVIFSFISSFALTQHYRHGQALLPWFTRRFIRIYPPLWLFYVFAFTFAMTVLGTSLNPIWIVNILGFNGVFLWSGKPIFAFHTWWVMFILASYAMFPLIVKILQTLKQPQRVILLVIIAVLMTVLQTSIGAGNTRLWQCVPAFWIGVEMGLYHASLMNWPIPTPSVVQWISTLSYEIYLYHPFFMRSNASPIIGNVAGPVALLYAAAATLLAAAVARALINIIIECATRRRTIVEKWDATI